MRIDVLYSSHEDLSAATKTEKPVEPIYSKIDGRTVHMLTINKMAKGYDPKAARHSNVSVVWTDDYQVTHVRLYPYPLIQLKFNRREKPTRLTLTIEGKYQESVMRK